MRTASWLTGLPSRRYLDPWSTTSPPLSPLLPPHQHGAGVDLLFDSIFYRPSCAASIGEAHVRFCVGTQL